MTLRSARLGAQAKLNLFLRILAREQSGYHQLETLFIRVDLADEVEVRVGGRGRTVECGGPAMPRDGLGPMENNLAWRAATAFAETGWPDSFAVEITKHIPTGGGLGGGSADAGAVLRALNALRPEPLPAAELMRIAARLGADVPFLTGGSVMALAWGRGGCLLELPAPRPATVALHVPSFGIATSDAYGWVDAAAGSSDSPPEPSLPLTLAALRSWRTLAPLARNDFEPHVAARHPEIAAAVARLRDRDAAIAMLAGSGSSVFGVFTRRAAPALARELAAGADAAQWVVTRTAAHVVPVHRFD